MEMLPCTSSIKKNLKNLPMPKGKKKKELVKRIVHFIAEGKTYGSYPSVRCHQLTN
ncbi:hypothetical protein HU200_063113 [Digitaria exilis]|uniref:Uncharacterized protein n=1 Tax=Digitaria exilis TaxID=1010633 RepID=A0A835DXM3_9POAL|nr:hypothetical protein HU200_063113 [Digitaria exilis]